MRLLFCICGRSSAISKQKLNNLVFVVPFSKLEWCYLLFVLLHNVHSLLDHVFNCLKPTVLYGIEQRRLSVLVDDVNVSTVGNQLLDCLVVTFTHTVEYGSLPINVKMIRVRATTNQSIDNIVVSLAHCVKKRQLLQSVFL